MSSDQWAKAHYEHDIKVEAVKPDLAQAAEPAMTPEDAACPILALAPAEYTYWEKRVWRRGVCDLETRREVAEAVRKSQDASEVQP